MSGPFIEVGAGARDDAILAAEYFEGSERHALNMRPVPQKEGIRFTRGNSNALRGLFRDGYFGAVFSNGTLEHDRYFWLSLGEMKRILRPGGFLMIGVPAFVPIASLNASFQSGEEFTGPSTPVFDVHHAPFDYWRFGRDAMEKVFFGNLDIVEIDTVMIPPRLIGLARKARASAP